MTNYKTFLTTCALILLTLGKLNAQDINKAINSKTTEEIQKWRLSLGGGYGFRVGNTDPQKENLIALGFKIDDVNDYTKQVMRGYKLAGQVHYMFWRTMGLGLDYNFYHTSSSISGYTNNSYYQNTITYSRIKNDFFTNFIGASLYSENNIGQSRFKAYSQVSLGISLYREEVLFDYTPMVATGNNLGVNLELGIEYKLNYHLALSLGVNYFGSSISKMKIDNGYSTQTMELEGEESESLSRLDFNLGVLYYF